MVTTNAVLTDSLDGHIARKYNMVTDFGKIWDSIADKALTGVAFVLLSVVGQLLLSQGMHGDAHQDGQKDNRRSPGSRQGIETFQQPCHKIAGLCPQIVLLKTIAGPSPVGRSTVPPAPTWR